MVMQCEIVQIATHSHRCHGQRGQREAKIAGMSYVHDPPLIWVSMVNYQFIAPEHQCPTIHKMLSM